MEQIKIGLLGLAILALASCKKTDIHAQEFLCVHTPIEIPLELSFQPALSVSRAAAQPESSNEGALSGTVALGDIDPNHNADREMPQSRAVDEAKVANVWVLQFDGTGTSAKLIYKNYIATYSAGAPVTVLRTATTNRVAIVANTFDAAFADGFVVGTATWGTVGGATQGVASQADVIHSSDGTEYLPLSGSYTGSLAAGGAVNVPLERTVVKLTINLRSGADLAATALNVQLCGVPNTSGWFADGGTGVWPASPTVISYAAENLTEITTSAYKTLTYWVPVNRRGTVSGTTGITRVTNAPAAATYLKVVVGQITYTIHLGGDFATDYNLKGNTAYTYALTLQTDPAQTDSRVSDQRALGTLVQSPAGTIAAIGGAVSITSPSAGVGLVWSGSTNPAQGYEVGAVSGSGPTGSVPVVVSVNPTNAVRSSVFTAKGINGKSSTLTISQAASALGYASASATTPVAKDATNVDFTVTGTAGLTLTFAKTSGDAAFSTPAAMTCDGTAQTVTVTMAANTGDAREAVYSATVTNPGASGLNLTDITVKQKAAAKPTVPNPPAVSDYVTVGGLKWAKGNLVAVNESNAKVGSATDYGLYFQFGSLVGWSGGNVANGDGTGTGEPALAVKVKPPDYNGSTSWPAGYYKDGVAGTGYGLPATDAPTTGIGDPCRYYLGGKWRTPTSAEYPALLGSGGYNTNQGVPLTVNGTSLSVPASGYRGAYDGSFDLVGSYGYYWSSSVSSAGDGASLRFYSGRVHPQANLNRLNGFPVRCVSE